MRPGRRLPALAGAVRVRPVVAPRKTWLWRLRRRWETLRPQAAALAWLAWPTAVGLGVAAAYIAFLYVTADRRHELVAGQVVATSTPGVAPFVLVRVRGKVLRVEGPDRPACQVGDRVDIRRTTIVLRSRGGGSEIIRWKPVTGCLPHAAADGGLRRAPAPSWSEGLGIGPSPPVISDAAQAAIRNGRPLPIAL